MMRQAKRGENMRLSLDKVCGSVTPGARAVALREETDSDL